jgi:HPt (histidine-containing phosphotransfer) domain-containing protein
VTASSPRLRLASVGHAFDLDAALASTCGDREFLEELLGIFLGDVPRYMADARQGVAERTPNRVARAAHTLRGAAAQLGALALAAAAFDVERAANGSAAGGAPASLEPLERAINELFGALGVQPAPSSSPA